MEIAARDRNRRVHPFRPSNVKLEPGAPSHSFSDYVPAFSHPTCSVGSLLAASRSALERLSPQHAVAVFFTIGPWPNRFDFLVGLLTLL
jgi:hypothetical protein